MKHIFGKNIEINHGCAIAIGKFDGLHKGHIALISRLKEVAAQRGLATAVLSFSPHPASVLSGEGVTLILSPLEKRYLLNQLGLDYFIEYPFTHEFAQISPDSFLKNTIREQLQGKALVVGENFRFGHKGVGDVVLAKKLGEELGLQVHTVPLVEHGTIAISANKIRRAVQYQEFCTVKDMCGRNFFLMGKVVCGKKRGREMGFPTANIIPHENKVLPPPGTYFTETHVDGQTYKSITTVDPSVVETHLKDFPQKGFSDDLYGHILRVDFLRWKSDSMSH